MGLVWELQAPAHRLLRVAMTAILTVKMTLTMRETMTVQVGQ